MIESKAINTENEVAPIMPTKIEVLTNGPLMVYGDLTLKTPRV